MRCWQEHSLHAGQEVLAWRFSLEDPHSKQRRSFANLEAMLVFLQGVLADDQGD
jgi:hypothetical protein